ncbi:MAG: DUF104 domain-containing protein [Planctomycetes bacterium]|nr:DUF104 domain-containing protein [Planctomycetota bacterium]
MSLQIDAIYDNGVLKPLVPLPLPDKARVKVTVETQLSSETKISQLAVVEALAPVRAAFASLELSEDEAVEIFEAEKHMLRRERRE